MWSRSQPEVFRRGCRTGRLWYCIRSMATEHPRHSFVEQATEQQGDLPPQTFPVNMYEAGDALVIVAPLPAVAPDDVSISLDGEQVVIEAALRTAAPKDYLLHEWRYGGYRR